MKTKAKNIVEGDRVFHAGKVWQIDHASTESMLRYLLLVDTSRTVDGRYPSIVLRLRLDAPIERFGLSARTILARSRR